MDMALLDGPCSRMNRREFARLGLAAAGAESLRAQPKKTQVIDDVLRSGRERRRIPAVVAMVTDGRSTLYSGAFGNRDAASKVPVHENSLFSIMSMTKAITTTAIMQLIEQGKFKLDDPAAPYVSCQSYPGSFYLRIF